MFIIILFLLIGLVVFFVIKNLVLKRELTKSKKIFYSVLISLTFSPLIYFLFVVGVMYLMSRESSKNFDEDLWNKSTNMVDGDFARYEMLDDLIEQQTLLNQDSMSIKNILGEPDYRDKIRNKWTYEAGTGGGFGFVDHYLEIEFNGRRSVKLEHKRIKD